MYHHMNNSVYYYLYAALLGFMSRGAADMA